MEYQVDCVCPLRCTLGEAPFWDEAGFLWFVDIKAPALHRYAPADGRLRSWPMPEPVGAAVPRASGGLLLALQGGFALFDPGSGALERLFDPEPDRPQNRLNDGKCDAQGRFWAGSMHDPEQAQSGDLYRLDPDFGVTRFPMGFVVTNGPAWSGDGRTFYFNDSAGGRIFAFDCDPAAGTLGARRLLVQVPEAEGHPDGQCIDAEDHLWTAHWSGARVTRYRPDGTAERTIALPVPLVSCCCFGGPDFEVLYVTTARVGLEAAALEAAPLSGGLFAVTGLGVRGRPAARFAG